MSKIDNDVEMHEEVVPNEEAIVNEEAGLKPIASDGEVVSDEESPVLAFLVALESKKFTPNDLSRVFAETLRALGGLVPEDQFEKYVQSQIKIVKYKLPVGLVERIKEEYNVEMAYDILNNTVIFVKGDIIYILNLVNSTTLKLEQNDAGSPTKIEMTEEDTTFIASIDFVEELTADVEAYIGVNLEEVPAEDSTELQVDKLENSEEHN